MINFGLGTGEAVLSGLDVAGGQLVECCLNLIGSGVDAMQVSAALFSLHLLNGYHAGAFNLGIDYALVGCGVLGIVLWVLGIVYYWLFYGLFYDYYGLLLWVLGVVLWVYWFSYPISPSLFPIILSNHSHPFQSLPIPPSQNLPLKIPLSQNTPSKKFR